MAISKEKDKIIQNKKSAIRALNDLLEKCISDSTPASLKKADLLSYWIKDYSKYLQYEDTFDSSRLPRYKRGSIVRVNFGFNVGKEFGGLHLAVVMDNDNKRNADVITVVPLSSTEGKAVHPRSVDLGVELYTRLLSHHNKMIEEVRVRNEKELSFIETYAALMATSNLSVEEREKITPLIDQLILEEKETSKILTTLEEHQKELERMKLGSMAVVNQITTVSKQRIYIPKKSTDFLYGITLSTSAMDKINEKLKELYIFE